MKVLITGSAGFVGFHTAKRFLAEGHDVVGYDGFTKYYDPQLKRDRDVILRESSKFTSVIGMLEDRDLVLATVEEHQPDIVVHLAAQAGVRYSIENPSTYMESNVMGTFNLLEALRTYKPKHFLFASTSSVYGGNQEFPFKETARVAFPVSLYAATKLAGEAIAHSYAHLFNIPTTGFRFFTVYGPWGRPDMALFKFTERIQRGEAIEVYGNGQMSRDFTYIDDLVEGIYRLSEVIPNSDEETQPQGALDSISPVAPWRVVNIAGGQPVQLMDYIEALEQALGQKAKKNLLPMQPGDVTDTLASPDLLFALTGFKPRIPVGEGVKAFVDWYTEYQHGDI